MTKSDEKITMIKPWSGGLNDYSLYITIPSEIVKKLKIIEDDPLFVRIKDDSTIIISKTNKIRNNTIQNKNEYYHYIENEEGKEGKEFANPLDGLDI